MTLDTLVFWDLDGTLLEFREPDGDRFLRALSSRDIETSSAQPELVGTTEFGILREYMGTDQDERILTLLRELDAEWLSDDERPIRPARGALTALNTIANFATQTVVTGNTYLRGIVKLERAGLLDSPIRTGLGAYGDESPDRRLLVRLATTRCRAELGSNHVKVIYIGDTPIEVENARAEGALVVLTATGKHSKEVLSATRADLVVDDLVQGLPDILRMLELSGA